MDFRKLALSVIEIETRAIQSLSNRLDERFNQACELILQCQGRVVILGMGKSGHIGNKMAATFASTGTPAFFVHPGEASHGDMGMITPDDVVILLSNSGTTQELVTLLPLFKRLGIPLIALVGNMKSLLAETANVSLDVSVSEEACPLNLAPTASTTATLVMGDALAIALLQSRNFTEEDFARSHPGGKLGRRLLLRVDDLMHKGEAIPQVLDTTPLKEAVLEVSSKKLGFTTVIDSKHRLVGIFTDGDLRRSLDQDLNLSTTPIKKVMSEKAQNINANKLAAEALHLMNSHKITSLVILDSDKKVEGVIHLHDLLQAGVL